MLGVGPGAKYKGNLTENSNSGVVVSPNDVYLIPPMIANLLLPKSQTAEKQTFSYADLLNTYIGVESYEKNLPHPDVTKDSTYSNVFKGRPLFGQFAPAAANFNDTSFWSILDLFLGAPINEMFTCLRPAPLEDGDSEHHIMPSFVMRQLPKTSLAFNEPDFAVTTFRSLPRWVIDDSFITNVNTGRSGALRFNYVQLRGFSPVEGDNVIKYMYILSPPVFDGADIKRSGLHTFIKDVKVIFKANGGDNKNYAVWNRFMADIVFEQHLTLTGTANLKGIEEPIVEGDNCVIGGTLYHIERVSHSGVLQPNGMKTFNTSLSLTHGIAVDPKFTSQTKDLAGYDEHSQALVAYSNLEDGNPLDGSFEDLPPEPKAPVNSGSFNSRPGQTEK